MNFRAKACWDLIRIYAMSDTGFTVHYGVIAAAALHPFQNSACAIFLSFSSSSKQKVALSCTSDQGGARSGLQNCQQHDCLGLSLKLAMQYCRCPWLITGNGCRHMYMLVSCCLLLNLQLSQAFFSISLAPADTHLASLASTPHFLLYDCTRCAHAMNICKSSVSCQKSGDPVIL